MTKKTGMTMGELEKMSGIRRSTIHYYVNCGLLHKPSKTGRTMALYDLSHLRELETIQKIKLNYIKATRASRVPIDHIRHKMGDGYSLARGSDASGQTRHQKQQKKLKRKKEEIIKATLKLYANRGYYLTNIRDIAREVNISAPTFYHYFSDKRELFAEVTEYVVLKYKQERKKILTGVKDPVERTRRMFENLEKHYPKMGEILNQLRSGAILGDSWAKKRLTLIYGQLMEHLMKEIKGAMAAGIIRKVDPELLAFFNIAIDELALTRTSMDNKYPNKEVIQFVADMFYHAFLTEKGKQMFRPDDQSNRQIDALAGLLIAAKQ